MDSRSIGNRTPIDADVCIVGAGPCGMVLARALGERGHHVLLIESGQRDLDAGAQGLNHGEVRGVPYADLGATRHRRVGGTAHVWNTPLPTGGMGAKYSPLDALDIADWPIPSADLHGYYPAAQEACGLGRFAYDAASWGDGSHRPWVGSGDLLVNRVYQFGPAEIFTHGLPMELAASAGVRILTGATACRLLRSGTRVHQVEVSRRGQAGVGVRAGTVVLASGGIENARLLLASGFTSEWLGRGFMEHPRDYSLVLIPSSGIGFEDADFYDSQVTPSGAVICGRLDLSEAARRREGLPNAAISIHLRRRPFAPSPVQRILRRLRLTGSPFGGGYGWSRRPALEKEFDAFRLVVNLEQRPRPANRIALEGPPDPFGVPRPVLHYGWLPSEQEELDRLRALLATWFHSAGLGRLEYRTGIPPDFSAHHHMGATRMASNAREGVVTPDCRVQGIDNLYVTGASVFPSGGVANPTLTAVALSLRLADHLHRA